MRKIIIACIFSIFALTGCSSNIFNYSSEEEVINEVKPIKESELTMENLYVKNDEGYLPSATKMYINFNKVATSADSSRLIYFLDGEDVLIPTMYKNDKLLFYTSQTLPTTFYFERFEDDGYSLGAMQLGINAANKCIAEANTKTFIEDSMFGKNVNKLVKFGTNQAKDTTIIINKVNGTPITFNSLSIGGTLTGFIYGNTYNVEYYIGSLKVEEDIVADTHFFTSFEMEETSKFELEDNFVKFDMSNCVSGYYFVNGYGFIRYVDQERGVDISKINFNTPRTENSYINIETTAAPIDGQEVEE